MIEIVAHARDDPRHFLPERLPPEFEEYESQVVALGAGAPGKLGLLELGFEASGGKTRLNHHYQRTPLQIFRPLYVDPERPDMAFIYLVQAGGGLLQGDRYRLDFSCGENTCVHITTQAATRLYKCEANFVTQLINIEAGPGAFVEYLPDITIPFRNSRFFQRTSLKLAPTATAIVGEILVSGRVAYGEHHDFDLLLSQTEFHELSGRLLVSDTLRLDPIAGPLDSPARLGKFCVLGMLYIVSQMVAPDRLVSLVRGVIEKSKDVVAGVSELPNSAGVSARILGSNGAQVELARNQIWSAARLELIGAPAPNLRKT